MPGVKTFQAVQPLASQSGNDLVAVVQRRMGQHRQAVRLMDQRDGGIGGDFVFGHPGGPAFLQVFLKRFIHAGAQPFEHQRPAHVRTPG